MASTCRLQEVAQHLCTSRRAALLRRNLPLLLVITFVPDKDFTGAVGSVLVDLLNPTIDVVEGLPIASIVNHDDAVRPAVVGGGDRAEALLPGCVPDLELDRLTVDWQGAESEVDTDGGDVRFRELVVSETKEQATLSNTAVAEQYQLEEVIVVPAPSG